MPDRKMSYKGHDTEDYKPIVFKPKRKKNIRQRKQSSDESEDTDSHIIPTIEEAKEVQKLRKRPNGVSVIGLATGQKVSIEEEMTCKDPFKIKSGGMINMSALKSGKMKQVDDAYDTGIGTQFSAETNKRDEDEEMTKYIEEELSKRKGGENADNEQLDASKYLSPEEAALLSLPEHLRHSSTNRSEEMLSNQMLSGIPEVDLGIDVKIKNIEATEEAKMKLLWERRNKKDGPSQFVPTNYAVNFVQHNRFNLDGDGARKRKPVVAKVEPPPKKEVVNIDATIDKLAKKTKEERATDDYHYEKFKKQFRRF